MRPEQVKTVTTLRGYTKLVEEVMNAATGPVWYRGCGSSLYDLIPTLYRHPTISDTADLVRLEARILARFKQRSIPYQTRVPVDDWDFLFLMQHVGVPTRLLDWSENPYIALYFALIDAERLRDTQTGTYSQDAAVWMLDPGEWNRQALTHMSFDGDILAVGDGQLEGYSPTSELEYMNKEPVALYGIHNSPRIVAQRGVFTIFGKKAQSMNEVQDELDFPPSALIKIEMPAKALGKLLKSIFAIGYTESVIFPDLDGLAREIRRHFGFPS